MTNTVAFLTKHKWVYVVFLVALSVASFWRYLGFTFWKDDWHLLWASLYDVTTIRQYWDHPMTLIEFVWLTRIFGTNPVWWQALGIGLRVACAYSLSLFASVLTGSPSTGLLTGAMYAGAVIGMDAVGWPSAHVVLVSSLFLLTGFTYLTRYLTGAKASALTLALLYLFLGFFADPFRNFPVLILVPVIPLVVAPSGERLRIFRKILLVAGTLGAVIAAAGIALYHRDIAGSQLFMYVARQPSASAVLKKIYVVGNYFNSIANIFIGWFIRLPEEASTGVYHPFVARLGFFISCILAGLILRFKTLRARGPGIIIFSLSWIFVTYIPNWLFEPRLTMGVTHRYMAISGIGFILLLGYILSHIRRQSVLIVCVILFIIANMWTAQWYLGIASVYRWSGIVSPLWETIENDVAGDQGSVFIFEGKEPLRTYALALSGPAPFAIAREVSRAYDMPIVTSDFSLILRLICVAATERFQPGAKVVQKDVIPLGHVYAWSVNESGSLTNTSDIWRKNLLKQANETGCSPLNN